MKTLVTLFAALALATAFTSCQTATKKQECKTTAKKQQCKTTTKKQDSCCSRVGTAVPSRSRTERSKIRGR